MLWARKWPRWKRTGSERCMNGVGVRGTQRYLHRNRVQIISCRNQWSRLRDGCGEMGDRFFQLKPEYVAPSAYFTPHKPFKQMWSAHFETQNTNLGIVSTCGRCLLIFSGLRDLCGLSKHCFSISHRVFFLFPAASKRIFPAQSELNEKVDATATLISADLVRSWRSGDGLLSLA